ncbi:MAG TPA: D-aminoacyl-tRNA deacylase [Candidatus Binatia bacterium]|jgi:D-tyrosyl-tRNA(Tyr) deacylase
MRAVIQRVIEARVSVGDEIISAIGPGLCILLGIAVNDGENNAEFLASKIGSLRIFEDEQGKMNRSVRDVRGELLVVSQFTLYGDCRKGNRPSFSAAAPPETAQRLYDHFIQRLRQTELKVATGEFRAHMRIALVNDGPVTLILEA